MLLLRIEAQLLLQAALYRKLVCENLAMGQITDVRPDIKKEMQPTPTECSMICYISMIVRNGYMQKYIYT